MTYILFEYLLYVSIVAALGLALFAATAGFFFAREGAAQLAALCRRLAPDVYQKANALVPQVALYARSAELAPVPVTTTENPRTAA